MEISGYRGFKKFTMDGLSRVNLLVGKNNCGKTSLLECVEFLASGGDPRNFIGIARRRGEFANDVEDLGGRAGLVDISHFFNGHQIRQHSGFSIKSDDGLDPVLFTVGILDQSEEAPSLFPASDDPQIAIFELVSGGNSLKGKNKPVFPLSFHGTLLIDHRRLYKFFPQDRSSYPPVTSVSPESLDYESMGLMWNSVLQTKSEKAVYSTLRILDPKLNDIVFEPNITGFRSGRTAGILVDHEGTDKRLPLGSLGDGMRRLLALALSLAQAHSGYLLIDEIDTGLHYSIMADMWKLVIKTAVKENIQVFATTHSYDCIRGLAAACDDEEMAGEVAVHKIHSELEKSVLFPGSELPIVSQHDIEVR